MKAVVAAAICSIAATSAALSASVTVPDSSASLAGVAGTTTAVRLDAGLRPQSMGGGVFALEAKNVHCDQYLNGALDASNLRAGLPALKCRINSLNRRGTTTGQVFGGDSCPERTAAEGAKRRRGCLYRLWHGVLRHLREIDQMHDRHEDRRLRQERAVDLHFHRRTVAAAVNRPSTKRRHD